MLGQIVHHAGEEAHGEADAERDAHDRSQPFTVQGAVEAPADPGHRLLASRRQGRRQAALAGPHVGAHVTGPGQGPPHRLGYRGLGLMRGAVAGSSWLIVLLTHGGTTSDQGERRRGKALTSPVHMIRRYRRRLARIALRTYKL